MKPYKPKNAQQKQLKNDPAHKMMRDAHKRLSGGDKTHADKYSKAYRRKNKAQIEQRHKRAAALKGSKPKSGAAAPATADTLKDACWDGYEAVGLKTKNGKRVPNCVPTKASIDDGYFYYEYKWKDGLTYGITLYGTRFACDCTAQRLGMKFEGILAAEPSAITAVQAAIIAQQQPCAVKLKHIFTGVYAGSRQGQL